MFFPDYVYLIIFITFLLVCSYPLGIFIAKVMMGEKNFLSPVFVPIENTIYKVCGFSKDQSSTWQKYIFDLILFTVISTAMTFFVLKFQNYFPLNFQKFPGLSNDLAFNTAVSFVTNTNWQSYGGESTMSYFSQMFALTPHNFMSAAVGLAAGMAVIRGLSQTENKFIGNFWVDMTRSLFYILFPLSVIFALFYISQGMIQNFHPYIEVETLEKGKQLIAQGPVASQIAIKLLGTNGGGFFNANAAHPFENPNALTNFFQMFAILLIPSAFVFTFGKIIKNMRHAFTLWTAMTILLIMGVVIIAYMESHGNNLFKDILNLSSAENFEGKEERFGIFGSSIFAAITTAASCGAVNAAHGSLIPLSGMIALINMLLNEVIFGGVGSGLYGMIHTVLLVAFVACLMIGRAPEYLGTRIGITEMKLIMVPLIGVILITLGLSAIACLVPMATTSGAGPGNPGPHGFSEILYAYTSTTQNNGSAFSSLSANNPFWNYTLSLAMLGGRFVNLIPMVALAAIMGSKKTNRHIESSFHFSGFTFLALLMGFIIILGALTYLPVLAIGPISEQLALIKDQLF